MPGFGGSASMALLTGIFRGANKADEEKRKVARENILNEYTQQQIDESQMRIERQQQNEARARSEARRADLEARNDEALEAQRLGTMAGLIQKRQPDLSDEEAMALVTQAPAGTLNHLLTPEDQEQLRPQDEALVRQRAAQAERLERENSFESRMSNFRNDPVALRMRQALVDGDRTALELAMTAARGAGTPEDPGHDEEIIMSFLEEVQPKDDQGNIRLTDAQKGAARVRGQGMAERMVQAAGSIEAAIAMATADILGAPADNAFDTAQQSETLRALERMQKERDGAEEPSAFEQAMIERLSGGDKR